jgi:lycopene cyclase domain-containing protein
VNPDTLHIHQLEYTILLLLCWIVPFLFTLVHHRMLKQYHYFLFNVSVAIAAVPFIAFDIVAVSNQYWQFNPQYTTPFIILQLPIEEFFFFFIVPQSCLLIWVGLKRYTSGHSMWVDIRNHLIRKNFQMSSRRPPTGEAGRPGSMIIV